MPLGNRTYQTLTAQVAEKIMEGIRDKTWIDWLPGERTLTQSLQVSRKTLRKALSQLHHDGILATKHGRGHRIELQSRPSAGPARELSVGLVTPESLENLRPYTALWIDELRSLLFSAGIRLATFSGHRFFSSRPQKAVKRLIEQNPQSCWVIAHSNEQMQRWFSDAGIPCIVAGTCHPGLRLPNVDWDYFASCSHAATALLRPGHRRVAFMTMQSQRAGDLESEAGFIEGIRRGTHGEVTPTIVRHDGTVANARRMLARLFDQSEPPTALLIANPVYYLTTVTFLAQRKLRVPQDVSLISREDDTFLAFLSPEPARYSFNPKIYAKRLFQPLLAMTRGEASGQTVQRIEPIFVPGASLAAPAHLTPKTP